MFRRRSFLMKQAEAAVAIQHSDARPKESSVSSCAPPPASGRPPERDLDPHRSTVPNAAGFYVTELDRDYNLVTRKAEQSDLRHCASCTCPPQEKVDE